MVTARFVRAMFAPLRIECKQLGIGRNAPEVRDDRAEFIRRECDADALTLVDKTFGVAGEVDANAEGGAFSVASACRTVERAFACTSRTRPKTTVSSSENAFAHCRATRLMSAVAGARSTGVAEANSTMFASAPSPEPTVTMSARANVASSCVTSCKT
jgi:hypothetical protein